MITFNVCASNGNFYRGHEPANGHGNCWSDCVNDALVLTIDQARALVAAWPGCLTIQVAIKSEPMSPEAFQHELFCAQGGRWYDYDIREPYPGEW